MYTQTRNINFDICGSYMFEFSVSKDMNTNFKNDRMEDSNISSSISSNTDCQGIKN